MESRIAEGEFLVHQTSGGFTEITFKYGSEWLRWGLSRTEARLLVMDLLDALDLPEALYDQVGNAVKDR